MKPGLVLRHEFVARVFIWAKFRPLDNSVRPFSTIPSTIHFIKRLFLNLNMGLIWALTIFRNQFFCFVLVVMMESAYKKWKCMAVFKLCLAPLYLKVSHSFSPILILIKITDKLQIHDPRVWKQIHVIHVTYLSHTWLIFHYIYHGIHCNFPTRESRQLSPLRPKASMVLFLCLLERGEGTTQNKLPQFRVLRGFSVK